MRLGVRILVVLVQAAVLLSLTAAPFPAACASTVGEPTELKKHSCCHGNDKTPASSHKHDCGGRCALDCCRAIMAPQIKLNRVVETRAIASALPASDFATDLSQPDAIFHPPRA